MAEIRRLLPLLLLVLAGAWAAPARAQDVPEPGTVAERLEVLRQLPPAEQIRLREALRRFRSLPAAERQTLRDKARALGAGRLRELSSRAPEDVERLRERHHQVERELAQILDLLGRERLSKLSPEEQAWVRFRALRGFHHHVRRKLLGYGTFHRMGEDLRRAPAAERRRLVREAMERLQAELLPDLPEAQRAKLAALPPRERASEVLAEFRRRETLEFVRIFEHHTLVPFLESAPEDRADELDEWRRRSRWFQLGRVLREEVGLPPETLRLLSDLRADDWAELRFALEETEDLPLAERRLRLREAVQRIHGTAATDPDRLGRGPRGLGRLLRERRLTGEDR